MNHRRHSSKLAPATSETSGKDVTTLVAGGAGVARSQLGASVQMTTRSGGALTPHGCSVERPSQVLPCAPMKVLCMVDLPPRDRARIAALSASIELHTLDRASSSFDEILRESEILAGWVDVDELARARRLRWLQLGSAGADRFVSSVPGDVILTTASGVFGVAIAEHVLAMMLGLARGIDKIVASNRERRWDRRTGEGLVRGGLCGATLAIVGLGDIGRALAVRAKAFQMTVLGVRHRPSLPRPPGVDEVYGEDGLDDVLARADHVVLALPATPRTDQLLDARRLGLMKRGAYVYNVGRGNAIDEAALVRALESGALSGAGLDVFATEPLPPDSPFYELENVVISPHSAGFSADYAERFGTLFADNLERYVTGRPLENVVDRDRGY